MNLLEFSRTILEGTTLEEKIIPSTAMESLTLEGSFWEEFAYELPLLPGRPLKLEFSERQMRFPSIKQWHDPVKRGMALHFFANHELLAIEMGAAALLVYPHNTQVQRKFKRGILATLLDEQRHFQLYLERMGELGVEFGDYPLNGFFWHKMPSLTTPAQYLAVMALTFESANLDFARYYAGIFGETGDEKSKSIMEAIFADEIRHVSFGRNFLDKWKGDSSLWDYYVGLLPFPMTPARSKGIHYFRESRKEAGFDRHFVEKLDNYYDTFKVTNRKSWTNNISEQSGL